MSEPGKPRPSGWGSSHQFNRQAQMLLERGEHRRGDIRRNPVTGAGFVHGEVDPQIEAAAIALRARDRFAREHPGLPLLPLNYADRERAKQGPDNFRIEHALGACAGPFCSLA